MVASAKVRFLYEAIVVPGDRTGAPYFSEG